MEKTNNLQLKILSQLLFAQKARFKELNVDALSTDAFSYHIRALLKADFIKKEGTYYSLTPKGKMVAAKLDTDTHKFEKQPKVSVILIPHKKVGNSELFLIQQRTKEPYFGYWGFIAGKIRWGELLAETANRELHEEAGLQGTCQFRYEIHEMVYDKSTKEMLEDKFFHVIEISNVKGELVTKTKDGVNKWVTAEEFIATTPKYHNENDLLTWYLKKDFAFKEEKYYIEKF